MYGYRPIVFYLVSAYCQDSDGNAGPYEWLSYTEVNERMQNFGSGLLHLDLVPERYGVFFVFMYHLASLFGYLFKKSCGMEYY